MKTVSIVATDKEIEQLKFLKNELHVNTYSQVLRSAIGTLEDFFLTKNIPERINNKKAIPPKKKQHNNFVPCDTKKTNRDGM